MSLPDCSWNYGGPVLKWTVDLYRVIILTTLSAEDLLTLWSVISLTVFEDGDTKRLAFHCCLLSSMVVIFSLWSNVKKKNPSPPPSTHYFHWSVSWSRDPACHSQWRVNAKTVFPRNFSIIPQYGAVSPPASSLWYLGFALTWFLSLPQKNPLKQSNGMFLGNERWKSEPQSTSDGQQPSSPVEQSFQPWNNQWIRNQCNTAVANYALH